MDVEIVVPVYNEERALAPSIRRLVRYLRESFPFTALITIADNGSTDGTWSVSGWLADEFDEVRAVRTDLPGKGRALRAVWYQSQADVLAYMDVDLSTDLNALLPLVAPIVSGHSDLAIGTRLAHGARVIRGPKREFISRCYNVLLRAFLGAGFSDAQCGFKAIRREEVQALLPLTEDTGWFFDTELLVLAERAGLRIHEVPVDWVDDLDSRVRIVATALADLRGIARLGNGLARGRIKVPALRHPSSGVPDLGGKLRGPLGFAAGLALTCGALGLLHAVTGRPGTGAEIAVIVGASLLVAGLRFALFVSSIFSGARRAVNDGRQAGHFDVSLAAPGPADLPAASPPTRIAQDCTVEVGTSATQSGV